MGEVEVRRARESSHLAAGPALGYVYQVNVALLALLPHALSGHSARLTLEVLDDIAIDETGGRRQLVQVTHSVDPANDLADSSAKIWRTLAIWIDEWKSRDQDESLSFSLITNRVARPGSGIESLTSRSSDLDLAFNLLVAEASGSTAQGSAADREKFLSLGEINQKLFLASVVVADGCPGASDGREALEKILMPAHEIRFVQPMTDAIQGWWLTRAVSALEEGMPITAEELRSAVDDARRQISDRSLPILNLHEFDETELPDPDPSKARFLLCLEAIGASGLRRSLALEDFRLAFAHRSRWTRHALLGPMELERYEAELFSQWVRACDRAFRDLPTDADDDTASRMGHGLWDELESSIQTAIRPETRDPFIQRGSLHRLADEAVVAWHPREVEAIMAETQTAPGVA